jgi:hypothetical protein
MRMTIPVGLLAVMTACAGASPRPQGESGLQGRWQGVVQRDGIGQPVEVDLSDSGSGWGGVLSTPDKYAVSLRDVSVTGNRVHFESPDGAYDGEASGDTITGNVTGSASGEFSLKKTEPDWNPFPNGP